MKPTLTLVSALAYLTCVVVLTRSFASPAPTQSNEAKSTATHVSAPSSNSDPFTFFTRHWRDDSIWHDGKAEYCLYDATRTIYGTTRSYRARIYTNKEMADAITKTKSADNKGRVVFKHHLREDIPTENYTYHYSTMCYVGATDLKSLKIDMGSQEDCGTTLKQYINHAGTCTWHQFTYFPNEGHRSGAYKPSKNFAFQNALGLVLRGYPFDNPIEEIRLEMVANQTSNHLTPSRPIPVFVCYIGSETLNLPIGQVKTHHLRISHTEGPTNGNRPVHDYWFAADGSVPRLHVMVQYKGPVGITYKLRKQIRWAYWKR